MWRVQSPRVVCTKSQVEPISALSAPQAATARGRALAHDSLLLKGGITVASPESSVLEATQTTSHAESIVLFTPDFRNRPGPWLQHVPRDRVSLTQKPVHELLSHVVF